MRKEHDLWQLDRLKKLCDQDAWVQTSNIVVTMSPYDKSRYILQSKASAS